MTMTRDRIEELKRLAEKATQDGWFAYNPSISPTVNPQQAFFLNGPQRISIDRSSGFRAEDAQFMAAANPQTILSLLALAERALEPQGSQKPLSPAMCALIELGQVEDGDADLLEPQGQALPELPPLPDPVEDVYARFRGENDYLPAMRDYYTDNDMQAYARTAIRAYSSQLALPAGTFQQRVQPWMMTCFGETISNDLQERNHRFLEEALELVQSTGCTQSEAHQLVDYVFGRPVGEPVQEVGGVMVTLAALCLAAKMDMHAAGETELARIWTKVDQIRAKQAAKPKHSPLPVALPAGMDSYRLAVDAEMGNAHIGVSTGDARSDLSRVIEWHVDVALDPAVSERARKLAQSAGPVPVQGKFFLLDPAGYSHPEIFDTEEERDAAAKDAIADHLDGDNGWSEEVENIVCGVITHEAGKVDIWACIPAKFANKLI